MTPDEFRIALVRLHLSQKAFAERTGLNLTTISRYATGRLEVPRIVEVYLELALQARGKPARQAPAVGKWWE